MNVLVSRAHEWREKITYHPAPSYRIERHPGVLLCVECGYERLVEVKSYVPCKRRGESPTSGYSGVLLDHRGAYQGRFRMAGEHPITGKPFAQWSYRTAT